MLADPKKRILVCTPSNAGVNEIVTRLVDGIPYIDPDSNTESLMKPSVVRIGRLADINEQEISYSKLRSVYLNTVFEDHAYWSQKSQDVPEFTNRELFLIFKAMKKYIQSQFAMTVETSLRFYNSGLSNEERSESAEFSLYSKVFLNEFGVTLKRSQNPQIQTLNSLIDYCNKQIKSLLEKKKNTIKNIGSDERENIVFQILSKTQVVCSTLAGAGHCSIQQQKEFDLIIIDEAGQAVEVDCLIPLQYKCDTCIMVGDSKQLQPTVFSDLAADMGYDISLFTRMAENQSNSYMLNTQYRMHPDISKFPLKQFYNNKVINGPRTSIDTIRPWHKLGHDFGTFRFFDISDGTHRSLEYSQSIINTEEVESIVNMYDILQKNTSIDITERVGIVTPYKAQTESLKKAFEKKYGQSEAEKMFEKLEISTVDRFQGQEKDIIMLSCVRSGSYSRNSIGFLKDPNRLNVAVTRAKSSLWVFGNGQTLSSNAMWRKMIDIAKDMRYYINAKNSFYFFVLSHKLQPLKNQDEKLIKKSETQNCISTAKVKRLILKTELDRLSDFCLKYNTEKEKMINNGNIGKAIKNILESYGIDWKET